MATDKPQQHGQPAGNHPKQGAGRPAQVPGDAESPAQGSVSKAAQKAPNRTDPTEPVRTGHDPKH